MSTHSVSFEGSHGQPLAGRLELPPDGQPRATALLAHCLTCSKDLTAVVRLSRALAERALAVLRSDFTGVGESEGDLAATTLASDVEDVARAAAHLGDTLGAPSLLVGHSLGGTAAVMAAGGLPSVQAVATIAAPTDAAHLRGLLARATRGTDAEGGTEVELGGRRFTLGPDFLAAMSEQRVLDAARELRAALLVLHSPEDELLPLDDAARLYTAAPHPKSFVALAGADHLLSRAVDADYAAAVIGTWCTRYLPPAPTPPGEAPTDPTRVTASTGPRGFRTEIGVRGHTLLADEPEALGGEDAGPTPYDLLVGALGACTSMTLQMYARRKQWPLREAIVHLRHSRVYAADQEHCADRPARLDRVERELELVGDLTAEQRARLLEIAGRCPVHRTLEAGVVVDTRLAAAE
jgi:putative redox protein